jgi:ATP-dependent DNA helicase RecG
LKKLGGVKGWVKVGKKRGEYLSRNESKILEAITFDPRITIIDLSEKIGIGTTAVENNLKKLKQKGAIVHVGPARGGHWEVIEE